MELEQVLVSGADSSGASAVSNPTMRKFSGAAEKGSVKGHVPVSMKRRRHISIERQRRVQMNTLLESLQALLPDSTPRKDRYTLLTEITNYLQSLEKSIQDLATCKEEIMSSLTKATTTIKLNKVLWITNCYITSMHRFQKISTLKATT
eukprot:c23367_g1_i2 orf=533-979(-)